MVCSSASLVLWGFMLVTDDSRSFVRGAEVVQERSR